MYKTYGSSINPLKTKINFSHSMTINGSEVLIPKITETELNWCGLIIDTKKLEISPDFSRILCNKLSSSVCIDYNNLSKSFTKSIKTFFRTKCHKIFFDKQINSKSRTIKSIYTSFLITAMRTHIFLKITGTQFVNLNPDYILASIEEGVIYGSRLVVYRTHDKTTKNTGDVSDKENNKSRPVNLSEISNILIRQLGLYAFFCVLKKHHNFYKGILIKLKNKFRVDLFKFSDEIISLIDACNSIMRDVIWN